MAYVIRKGKRYRLSLPHASVRYEILRYVPAFDELESSNDEDRLLFIDAHETGIIVECDGDDAKELERIINGLDNGSLSHDQFRVGNRCVYPRGVSRVNVV